MNKAVGTLVGRTEGFKVGKLSAALGDTVDTTLGSVGTPLGSKLGDSVLGLDGTADSALKGTILGKVGLVGI